MNISIFLLIFTLYTVTQAQENGKPEFKGGPLEMVSRSEWPAIMIYMKKNRQSYVAKNPKTPPMEITKMLVLEWMKLSEGAKNSYLKKVVGLRKSQMNDRMDPEDEPKFPGKCLVETSTCCIPDLPAWDNFVSSFIYEYELPVCDRRGTLIYRSGLHQLRLNRTAAAAYGATSENLYCCYHGIQRPDEGTPNIDDKYKLTDECQYWAEEHVIDADFVFMKCEINGVPGSYKDVFAFPKIPQESRSEVRKLSVALIGHDTLSRLNFIRQLPESYSYLRNELKSIEMSGYHVLGHSTFDNIVPMLTGLNIVQLRKLCFANTSVPLDKCPWIWKLFKKFGYTTAFSEDAPHISMFNLFKAGFKYEPTDLYTRHLMVAAETLIGDNHEIGSYSVCTGTRVEIDIQTEWKTNMMKYYKDINYFLFSWSNGLSHNSLNKPKLLDNSIKEFLVEVSDKINNTILIFFSDHGLRVGSLRKTARGKLEVSLPFLHVVLPPWFKDVYPTEYKNLMINTKRITSLHDVYETLRHVIDLNEGTRYRQESIGNSLFVEISEKRRCIDVGVNPQWCTCDKQVKLDVHTEEIKKIAYYVLDVINKKLEDTRVCSQLRLQNITRAAKKLPLEIPGKARQNDHDPTEISIIIQVSPSDGLFETTVLYQKDIYGNVDLRIVGKPERINKYGSQSDCIQDLSLREYCYCTAHDYEI